MSRLTACCVALLLLSALLCAEDPANDAVPPVPVLGFDGARHLLSRTGFGASLADIQELAGMTRVVAANHILSGMRTTPLSKPPAWVADKPSLSMSSPDMGGQPRGEEARKLRQEVRRKLRRMGEELKEWWYVELLTTDSPLTERMVLFWHNHFTSGLRKVRIPHFLHRQNALFRKHAKGNFRELLHAIVMDPAMALYLDSSNNKKGKPNENFAREILELFTLGEGNYTENDIKEAARAFTGIRVNRREGRSVFVRRRHDSGSKEFLGKKSNFGPRAIIEQILEQKQTALFITEKLWREFISDAPDPDEISRLATIFRTSDYELEPLLSALFSSAHMYDEKNRGCMIKSPVDLIVGTLRSFGVKVRQPSRVSRTSRSLGQDLLDPPNVKGWPGGENWITSSTLLLRQQFLTTVFRGGQYSESSMQGKRQPRRARRQAINAWRKKTFGGWMESLSRDPQERQALATRVMLPIPPVDLPDSKQAPEDWILQLVLDPTYQLK